MNIVCKLVLIAILGITVAGQEMTSVIREGGFAYDAPKQHKGCMQFVNEQRESKGLVKWENNKEWGAHFAQMFKDKCPEEGRYWVNDKSSDGSKSEYEVGKLAAGIPQSLLSTSQVKFACMELTCGDATYFFVGTGAHSLGDSFESGGSRTQVGVQPESGQLKSMESGVVGAQTGAQSMDSPTSSSTVSSSFLLFSIGFLAVVRNF